MRQIHQQHAKCNCEEAKHRYCKISMSINLEILRQQTQTIYTTPLYLRDGCLFTGHTNKKQTSWPSKLFKLVSTCFSNFFKNQKRLWGSNSLSLLPNPSPKKKTPKTACLRPTGNHDFDQAAAAPTYQRLRPRRRPVDATPGHRRGESGRPGSFPLHLSEENNEIMEICERGQVNNNLEIEVDQKVKVVFKQN